MHATHRFRWLSILVVALVVAACGGGDDGEDAADTTTTTTTEAPTTVDEGPERAAPTITVLDQGSEPRRALRIEVEEGHVSETVMTMTMGIAVEIDGEPIPQNPVPATRMRMRNEVVSVDRDAGTITTRFQYADADIVDDGTVDPNTAAQMRAALEPMNRVTGTMVVDDRGNAIDGGFDMPDDLDPNSRQLMEQMGTQLESMMIPLPEEEVGQGARWRARTTSALGGIETVLDMTYELRELDGTRYVLDVSYEQTAEPQEAEFPGAPPGTVSRVTEYLVEGEGDVEGDLTELFPARSQVVAGGDIVMTVEDDTESIEVRQRMDLDVRLEDD